MRLVRSPPAAKKVATRSTEHQRAQRERIARGEPRRRQPALRVCAAAQRTLDMRAPQRDRHTNRWSRTASSSAIAVAGRCGRPLDCGRAGAGRHAGSADADANSGANAADGEQDEDANDRSRGRSAAATATARARRPRGTGRSRSRSRPAPARAAPRRSSSAPASAPATAPRRRAAPVGKLDRRSGARNGRSSTSPAKRILPNFRY